tara:strand:- start:345 stop:650 length:306 start_codon:yes stop_codon:yes gene_type:complete
MSEICDAILAINPSAEVTIDAEDIDRISWLNGTTPISKSDIQAKMADLKTAYDNAKYQRDRAEKGYASLADQMDMQYWDSVNGTTTWKDHVDKVKSDFPKP